MKIAFIDTFGLCYDGTTLTKRGLGGSESAVILCSRELAKLGFDVTVFNDCTHDDTSPGTYDNVRYRPLQEIESTTDSYDVLIGSRSVAAFAPAWMRERFKTFSYMPDFSNIQQRSNHKVLWMHDTFCDGDDLIEDFLLNGYINEIFTLSDWHTVYVSTCDHGKRRMFEVMKKYVFITRNGMTKYHDWVDITKKDPNHFVYNSSVTKGMRPLVYKVWPRIREMIPDAKLTIIGGYYRMRSDHAPDQQEIEWREMVANNPDINFTGVIKQSEIADILCDASYMIYPADFPETFGISTLESLYYNTPVITCYFGALEETAFDAACYKLPYCVVPNGLFPNINQDEQAEKFVQLTMEAYNNKYLHQQKMYACNAVKDISGWDSVALQWKQHLFKKLGWFMPVDEYRKAQEVNYKVRKTFGRRFVNEEEVRPPTSNMQREIGVITAVYNAENYIEKCIRSVAQQDYRWYTMYIVDDASTDNTAAIARSTIDSLPEDIRNKFVLIRNKENIGAVANHYKIINEYIGDENFFMILDGDDWLVNNPNIFHLYNNLYHDGAEFTYGSCWSLADNIPLVAQPYPPEVKAAKDYRNYKFNWGMPYTHLRTFHAKLLRDLTEDDLKVYGQWPKAGGDNALFYYLIEKADPEKVVCVTDINYVYNDTNPLNDYKINGDEQNKTAAAITNRNQNSKQYTVVVPTMWKYEPFKAFLNELLRHNNVGEVILIDNDPMHTPYDLPENSKLRYKTFGANIFVNPSWNWGVENAAFDYVCILNDDMKFDLNVLEDLKATLEDPNTGVCGIIPGVEQYGQPPVTDGKYNIVAWTQDIHQFGFGCLMFVNKNNWTHIPDEIKVYYGDYFIFDTFLASGKTNYCILNMNHETPYAQTCEPLYIKDAERMTALQEKEGQIYESIKQTIWNKPEVVVPVKPVIEEVQAVVEMPREKTILIAIPTNKNIEAATYKSIFDLKVPKGYKLHFQYFYGYQIDQIRNLIAEWGKGHDYLFCVDSDVVLPDDTLLKMVGWDRDIVSGLYIQRIPGTHTLEIYEENGYGGVINIPWENIKLRIGLMEIAACGFGCVLIKSEVLKGMEYPHFVYRSALDHAHTYSEDVYFCQKAREAGFKIYADTTILCDHVGSFSFKVQDEKPKSVIEYIRDEDRLPKEQVEYLHSISSLKPKVVYDIGACVLHWERHAKAAWPDSKFVLFDAEPGVERILMESGHPYHIGLLTDRDGREVDFYHWLENPGGNSYYKEITPGWDEYGFKKTGYTLDTIVKLNNFPLPDLIKLDVQGAEIDVLKGAKMCLEHCSDVILEAQHKTYNEGAPQVDDVLKYMDELGFELVANINRVEFDGDYHFKKKGFRNSCGPTKAVVIRTYDDPLSASYAAHTEQSCRDVGLEVIQWNGFNKNHHTLQSLTELTGVKFGSMDIGAACASASHYGAWQYIASLPTNDPVVVLEHDAIMLHPIKTDAPLLWDNNIIALGYKLSDPTKYDHITAGRPNLVIPRKRHSGAHAYMITPNTARALLKELAEKGSQRAIDNFYFMRVNDPGDTESDIPLSLMVPTPAIAWLRKSTIWEHPSTLNYDVHESFSTHHSQ